MLLTNDSRVLVTGWVARPTRLTIGLTLAQADRRYAGKVSFTSDVLPGGAFFELDLLGADFAPLARSKGGLRARDKGPSTVAGGTFRGQASGSIIEDWWCVGHGLESGLKIRQVEIQPAKYDPGKYDPVKVQPVPIQPGSVQPDPVHPSSPANRPISPPSADFS